MGGWNIPRHIWGFLKPVLLTSTQCCSFHLLNDRSFPRDWQFPTIQSLHSCWQELAAYIWYRKEFRPNIAKLNRGTLASHHFAVNRLVIRILVKQFWKPLRRQKWLGKNDTEECIFQNLGDYKNARYMAANNSFLHSTIPVEPSKTTTLFPVIFFL